MGRYKRGFDRRGHCQLGLLVASTYLREMRQAESTLDLWNRGGSNPQLNPPQCAVRSLRDCSRGLFYFLLFALFPLVSLTLHRKTGPTQLLFLTL